MFNFIYQQKIKSNFETNDIKKVNSNIDQIIKELLRKDYLKVLNDLQNHQIKNANELTSKNSLNLKLIRADLNAKYESLVNINYWNIISAIIFGIVFVALTTLGDYLNSISSTDLNNTINIKFILKALHFMQLDNLTFLLYFLFINVNGSVLFASTLLIIAIFLCFIAFKQNKASKREIHTFIYIIKVLDLLILEKEKQETLQLSKY